MDSNISKAARLYKVRHFSRLFIFLTREMCIDKYLEQFWTSGVMGIDENLNCGSNGAGFDSWNTRKSVMKKKPASFVNTLQITFLPNKKFITYSEENYLQS